MAFTAALSEARADIMNCTIDEGGTKTLQTKIQHQYDENSVHDLTPFDTAYATGFVAVSKGYGVVNVVSKDTGKAVASFMGKMGGGNFVSGNVYLGKNDGDYFTIECK